MEALHLLVLFAGVFLLIAVQSGDAIWCVSCNSKYDEGCDDPFPEASRAKYSVNCDLLSPNMLPIGAYNFTRCRKMDMETKLDKVDKRVLRQCAVEGREEKCVDRSGTKNVFLKYCHCSNDDNCNSAASLGISAVLLLLTAAVWHL